MTDDTSIQIARPLPHNGRLLTRYTDAIQSQFNQIIIVAAWTTAEYRPIVLPFGPF